MSIDDSGLNDKVTGRCVSVKVTKDHPLIKLSNVLPWSTLASLVLPDLQSSTTKKKWWMGRPLRLRMHLGVYFLQQLFNLTDRKAEYSVKENAAYQLFCGAFIVDKWHCPDHTKIEAFRSRLTPETQQQLANELSKVATELGFANPAILDIDSTVQESNMSYPSDIHLLTQLAIKAKKIWTYLQKTFSTFTFDPFTVDLKGIKKQARVCYFSKTKDLEKKNQNLKDLWVSVYIPVKEVVKQLKVLDDYDFKRMPWNLRRLTEQLQENTQSYCMDVMQFWHSGVVSPTKRLCFHLREVACFNKNKLGKKYQFGRAFQIGRLGGNFLMIGKSTSVRMDDRASLPPMLELHRNLFPGNKRPSVATDKGYYSKKNSAYLKTATGSDLGLQKPITVVGSAAVTEEETELINRRAGIEPLIGHAKHGGQLGKSRMKYDRTAESAGYAAILGFNGRQLIRYLMGKAIPPSASMT